MTKSLGLAGDDRLFGSSGDDLLLGGGGNDLLIGEAENDFVDGGNGNDRLSTSFVGNDILFGGNGDDTLSAITPGNHQLIGGGGNDDYLVGNGVDARIIEEVNGGIDTVISPSTNSGSFTLGTNLENLDLLFSSIGVNGTGNSLNNTITGKQFQRHPQRVSRQRLPHWRIWK